MRYFFITLLILCMALTVGCQKGENAGDSPKDKAKAVTEGNIFLDKVLQEIYSLQNKRAADELHRYFTHENPVYRRAAAIGAASVQSPKSLEPLLKLMADEKEPVRAAAAYALGQLKNKDAEPFLIEAFGKQQAGDVKFSILEAIGKCGTAKGLDFIVKLEIPQDAPTVRDGQAMALYRFALHKVVSAEGTALAFNLLKQEMPERTRLMAAQYLARSREINLADYHIQLLQAFDSEKNVFVRMSLVQAMGKAVQPKVKDFLTSILNADINDDLNGDNTNQKVALDYRIKVNGLRALGSFGYDGVKEIFFKQCSNSDSNIAVAASEFFTANGVPADAHRYFDTAQKLTDWRCRSNMLSAALRHFTDKEGKKKIFDYIKAAYEKSTIDYEKANLLSALGSDIDNLEFLETQIFENVGKTTVISSYGLGTLTGLYGRVFGDNQNKGKEDEKSNKQMLKAFAGIFKKAVGSGDSAMAAVAAGMLRNPKINFKDCFADTSFLNAAMEKCKLPKELETREELKKTIDYFNGTAENEQSTPPEKEIKNKPIDWELVTSISPEQRIRIKTTKGNITIRLMVNDSPGSTANFISLIKEKFYKKSVFHRVVPNFVIQDGCPRGDGWGGPEFTIGSELGPLYYGEGSVGMASAGKDTEGSQWFITHSPTPHLDGSYSIFATVVEGMDVVHKIEMGDKIIDFEIISQ